jgi:hypothetical protein
MSRVIESRRSQRFPIKMPIRFRVSGEYGWRSGRTINISSSGVFFRCLLSADCGTHVEMNFVLSGPRVKESGLEVACNGEVVRLELSPVALNQPLLAVKISDYRLSPYVPGQSNVEDPLEPNEDEE